MREGVKLGFETRHYEKKQSRDERHYFNLINDSGEVIARRIEFFNKEEERDEAVRYLRRFLMEKYSGEGMFLVNISCSGP